MGHHTADGLVEDAGRSAEVEGTTTGGVETSHLAKVGVVLDCTAEFRVSFLISQVAVYFLPKVGQMSYKITASGFDLRLL